MGPPKWGPVPALLLNPEVSPGESVSYGPQLPLLQNDDNNPGLRVYSLWRARCGPFDSSVAQAHSRDLGKTTLQEAWIRHLVSTQLLSRLVLAS